MNKNLITLFTASLVFVMFQNCAKNPDAVESKDVPQTASALGTNNNSGSGLGGSILPLGSSPNPNAPVTVSNKTLLDSFVIGDSIYFIDKDSWYVFDVKQSKFVKPENNDNKLSSVWGNDVNAPKNYSDIKVSFQLGDNLYFLDSTSWYAYGKSKARFLSPQEINPDAHDRLLESVWGADPNAPPKESYAKLTISFELGDKIFFFDDLRWYAYDKTLAKFLTVKELNPNLSNRLISSVWGDIPGAPTANAQGNYKDLTVAFYLGANLFILSHTDWFCFDSAKGEFVPVAMVNGALQDRKISSVWGGVEGAPQGY